MAPVIETDIVLRDGSTVLVRTAAGEPVRGGDRARVPTSLSRAARERVEERQRTADVAAVAHVLRPASVA